jgi:hypothetical protein
MRLYAALYAIVLHSLSLSLSLSLSPSLVACNTKYSNKDQRARYRSPVGDPLILPSPRDESVHREGRVPMVSKKKGRKETKGKSKTRVSPRAAKGRRSGATVRRMMKSFFRFGIARGRVAVRRARSLLASRRLCVFAKSRAR